MNFMKDAAERSIKLGFLSTANWRERVGKRSDTECDAPNAEAAVKLRAFNNALELTDALDFTTRCHFNEADRNWLRAVRDTNRALGYSLNVSNVREYIGVLLSSLTGGAR
jgi:hypothetical protein